MATTRLGEWGRRVSRTTASFSFSYKKLTVAVCSVNLIAALLLVKTLYVSLSRDLIPYIPDNNPFSGGGYSADQVSRIEEAIRARQAAEPVELMNLVKKFRKEAEEEERRWEASDATKKEMVGEILGRIRKLKDHANDTEKREAVELWRVEKLKEVKRMTLGNLTADSSIPAQEAKMLERALELDWRRLLEDIGFWMPPNVHNKKVDDEPINAQLEEEEIIPGRSMLPECHAELHTDYDGIAVKWGLTHHKESAADCCQACLDHARHAKLGERKCNIWVYCPSEYGCYSPDIYEHKHQECWLKQAEKPRLNFKEKYSENYRDSHPSAPIVVPWMSGVVGG